MSSVISLCLPVLAAVGLGTRCAFRALQILNLGLGEGWLLGSPGRFYPDLWTVESQLSCL